MSAEKETNLPRLGDSSAEVGQSWYDAAIRVFWATGWAVHPRTGCWLWRGATNGRGGYGRIQVGKRRMLAHRLALELAMGRSIHPGMLALHSCDRPRCVNPGHLREGTPADNMMDRLQRTGYFGATLTRCSRGHLYTPETTGIWRDRFGRAHRKCRLCDRDRHAAARASA